MSALRVVAILAVLGVIVSTGHAGVSCPAFLCTAAETRNEGMLRGFDDPTVDVCTCVCNDKGDTLLHVATRFEAVAFLDLLVRQFSCDVDVTNVNGDTPLHSSATYCITPTNSLLLGFGADFLIANDDDLTPLCLAAKTDNPNCAGIIIQIDEQAAEDGVEPPIICQRCDGLLPYDFSYQFGNQIVQDIIGQRGGSPAACAATG